MQARQHDIQTAHSRAVAPQSQSCLFGNQEAATYLGIKSSTLEVWRCTKRTNIPYIKVGRLVKYRQSDLDAWLASRTIGEAQAA